MSVGYTAVDSGFGYTYLDPKTGHELSAVAGFTYNGMNSALQYRNGVDFHFDWAVSQFVSKSVLVGIAAMCSGPDADGRHQVAEEAVEVVRAN